jgi:hypothetical protein
VVCWLWFDVEFDSGWVGVLRIGFFFISKYPYLVDFMILILFLKFNSIYTVTSFKILNDMIVYILLDL